MSLALSSFLMKSSGYATETVATYGISCAAMILGTSFFFSVLPLSVEVVQLNWGVQLLRWMPVFIYASLSKQK